MKKVAKRVTLGIFFLLIFAGCSEKTGPVVILSESEKDWITKNKSITLSIDHTNVPLNFLNEKNQIVGYNIDLLKLLEKKTGVKLIFVGSSWQQALSKALNYEVDGIINADITEKRKEKLLFTEGFFNNPKTLVYKGIHKHANDLKSFAKYKIGVVKNTVHLDILKENIPDSNIVEVVHTAEAYKLFTENKIQCVFSDYSPLRYWINKDNVKGVHIGYIETVDAQTRIAIRKDKPLIVSILNKGIAAISVDEKNELLNNWIGKKINSDSAFK